MVSQRKQNAIDKKGRKTVVKRRGSRGCGQRPWVRGGECVRAYGPGFAERPRVPIFGPCPSLASRMFWDGYAVSCVLAPKSLTRRMGPVRSAPGGRYRGASLPEGWDEIRHDLQYGRRRSHLPGHGQLAQAPVRPLRMRTGAGWCYLAFT